MDLVFSARWARLQMEHLDVWIRTSLPHERKGLIEELEYWRQQGFEAVQKLKTLDKELKNDRC